MAFQVTVDLLVHLDSFKNLELFSRGLYYLRVQGRVHHSGDAGTPYATFAQPATLDSMVGEQRVPVAEHPALTEGQLTSDGTSYVTRVFPIRYRDEVVELNEGVHFQLGLSADEAEADAEVEVFLFFCAFEKSRDASLAALIPSNVTYECVANQRILVRNLANGLHAFFPATFDDMHFCELAMTFHALVTNVRYMAEAHPSQSRDIGIAAYLFPPANRNPLSPTSSSAEVVAPSETGAGTSAPQSRAGAPPHDASEGKMETPPGSSRGVRRRSYVTQSWPGLGEAGPIIKAQYILPLLLAHEFASGSLEWAAGLLGLDTRSPRRRRRMPKDRSPSLDMQFAAAGRGLDPIAISEALERLELDEIPAEVKAIGEEVLQGQLYQRADVITSLLSLGRWPVALSEQYDWEEGWDDDAEGVDTPASSEPQASPLTVAGITSPGNASFAEASGSETRGAGGAGGVTPLEVAVDLTRDLHTVAQYCFAAWTKFATLVPLLNKGLTHVLRRQWRKHNYRAWTARVATHAYRKGSLLAPRSPEDLAMLCDNLVGITQVRQPDFPPVLDLGIWASTLFASPTAGPRRPGDVTLPVAIVEQYLDTATLNQVNQERVEGKLMGEVQLPKSPIPPSRLEPGKGDRAVPGAPTLDSLASYETPARSYDAGARALNLADNDSDEDAPPGNSSSQTTSVFDPLALTRGLFASAESPGDALPDEADMEDIPTAERPRSRRIPGLGLDLFVDEDQLPAPPESTRRGYVAGSRALANGRRGRSELRGLRLTPVGPGSPVANAARPPPAPRSGQLPDTTSPRLPLAVPAPEFLRKAAPEPAPEPSPDPASPGAYRRSGGGSGPLTPQSKRSPAHGQRGHSLTPALPRHNGVEPAFEKEAKLIASELQQGRPPPSIPVRRGSYLSAYEKPDMQRVVAQLWRQGGLFLEALGELGPTGGAAAPGKSDAAIAADRGQEHVILVVHGFQGTAFDMRLIKNWLRVMLPEAVVHVSGVNEKALEVPLATMGDNFAKDVRNVILDKAPWLASSETSRLSFIGHSLGALVVREALAHPALRLFLPRLHTFISLSSPHLGQMFSRSQLVQSGIWALTKLRRADVLMELKLQDHREREQTSLFRLSQTEGLEHFRHVVLVSSHQDEYVPLHSARIQICEEAEKATERDGGPLLIRMAANLIGRCHPCSIIRIELQSDFSRASSRIDTLIGRSAHIAYLDNQELVQFLLFTCLPVLC